jgi:nanoRNase/pAp phosphatase (c-di-AMP/oligoRNAs hydrolase)
MVDSGNLRYSNNQIIPILQYLINKGADLQKNRDLVLKTIDKQERIARIKGAIRSEDLVLIKDWIVLYTTVNSFEASVSKALIDLGADIAFCLSNKKGEYRLIVRTSESFSINSNLNFGKFMESLGKQVSGVGGGHKGAAGLQGIKPPNN